MTSFCGSWGPGKACDWSLRDFVRTFVLSKLHFGSESVYRRDGGAQPGRLGCPNPARGEGGRIRSPALVICQPHSRTRGSGYSKSERLPEANLGLALGTRASATVKQAQPDGNSRRHWAVLYIREQRVRPRGLAQSTREKRFRPKAGAFRARRRRENTLHDREQRSGSSPRRFLAADVRTLGETG
jgi:hypothetical protein